MLARHRTPSGGWHLLIRSTGIAKISPLANVDTGEKIGDYCGGTTAGSGRMLSFLPGSKRPKHGAGYTIEKPLNFSQIAGPADPIATSWLLHNGESNSGKGAKASDEEFAADWIRSLPAEPFQQCRSGSVAFAGIMSDADKVGSGGRDGRAVKAACRIIEWDNSVALVLIMLLLGGTSFRN